MTAKKTIAFWLGALLLFGWWWVVERVPATTKATEVKREQFINVFRDDVNAVELEREGRAVRAERKEKRWQVVEPKGVAIPNDLFVTLVESITEAQDAEVVNEKPEASDIAAFGLDQPRTEIRLELTDGKKMNLEFGGHNPPRTAIYARSDASPQIYLIGLNLEYYGDLLFQAAFPSGKIAG